MNRTLSIMLILVLMLIPFSVSGVLSIAQESLEIIPEQFTEEEFQFLRETAEQGDAEAQLYLGACYWNGVFVTEDKTEAREWFRKSAEQGNMHAQYVLGACYFEENQSEAVEWLRKSAEQGLVESQYVLGGCYANGIGVEVNQTEAVKWLRKAVEQGYEAAIELLKKMEKVCDVSLAQESAEAIQPLFLNEATFQYLRELAEQGDPIAQHALGLTYLHGFDGVEANRAEAVEWLRKSAEQGHEQAKISLEELSHWPEYVYVMSYFVGNGEDGLHLCGSVDGLTWKAFNDGKSVMPPTVGNHKLVRDPSIVQAPDGTFHMVWTISWTQAGIGYASSKDLVNWSEQKLIPLMEEEPTTRNCWAPELFFDAADETYYIYWSSTIPGRFDGPGSEDDYNHRQYYVTTKDFQTFTPTKLFFDPGHNVIDGFLARDGERYLLFYKDETLHPEPRKSIHLAVGETPVGPFVPQREIGHTNWIEGPSAIKIGDFWYVYYDCYAAGHYGAVRSSDLESWENITEQLSFPEGVRHGTIFRVRPEVVQGIKGE